jgi:hypothetical protein
MSNQFTNHFQEKFFVNCRGIDPEIDNANAVTGCKHFCFPAYSLGPYLQTNIFQQRWKTQIVGRKRNVAQTNIKVATAF